MTYCVLISSRTFGPYCPEAVQRLRDADCELIPNEMGRGFTEQEIRERICDIDALIAGSEPLTASVLEAANRLKIIARHGVGFENVDLVAAKARGIPVALAGGTISESVADMAMALLLALARHIPQSNASVHQGHWKNIVGVELRGKTLGIIGLGQIGKEVCQRARGFGMSLVAYDPYHDEQFAQTWGVRYLALEELLATSDFISLHTLVTPETRHIINTNTLTLMKSGAYLINTARGELIDEKALTEALRNKRIAGAACDVFEHEPPTNSELLTLDNFIATPHSASQTYEGLRRCGEVTAENVLLALAGKAPRFQIA